MSAGAVTAFERGEIFWTGALAAAVVAIVFTVIPATCPEGDLVLLA